MNLKVKVTGWIIVASMLLSACNLPSFAAKPTVGMELIQTAAAQTIAAIDADMTKTAQAIAGTSGLPSLVPSNTAVSPGGLPTQTPFPTQTAYPTLTPVPTSVPIPCDRALFVKDVTIPDGTLFGPNSTFTKTWRLKNDGSCTWTPSYKIVFFSGDAMSAPASVALSDNVAPGQEVDLSVSMKSPAASGTYRGNWRLQNASGVSFGLGNSASAFYVTINVGTTAAPFAVTSVTTSASPNTWAAACPFTITLKANITSAAAGTVTYFWERSDGATMASRSVTFTEAGTKAITEELVGGFAGYTFNGNYRIYIDNPNHQYFGPVNLNITCP